MTSNAHGHGLTEAAVRQQLVARAHGRREFLRLVGFAGAAALVPGALAGCADDRTPGVITGPTDGPLPLRPLFDVQPGSLPAGARQVPRWQDFARIRAAAAGAVYTDPYSGVRVVKLTDAMTPEPNVTHSARYAAGGPYTSSRRTGNAYTILFNWRTPAGVWKDGFAEYTRGGGVSAIRDPGLYLLGTLPFGFSMMPSTAHIFYHVTIAGRLRRFNTQTMSHEEGVANIPVGGKDLSAQLAGCQPEWLTISADDGMFVLQAATTPTKRAIAWDRVNDVVHTVQDPSTNPYLDELKVDKAGRWVALVYGGTPPNVAKIWNLRAAKPSDFATAVFNADPVNAAHSDWLGSVLMCGNRLTGEVGSYDPATQLFTGSGLTEADILYANRDHACAQWVQGGQERSQWVGGSGYYTLFVDEGPWTSAGGSVYYCTPDWTGSGQGYVGVKRSIGLLSTWQRDAAPAWTHTLARATSRAAMVEGSFYHDAAADRWYVWCVGGGSPAGRVRGVAPQGVTNAVSLQRGDYGDLRHVCHSHTYWDGTGAYGEQEVFASQSPDGEVFIFQSNMGVKGGRRDLFVAEVPLPGARSGRR